MHAEMLEKEVNFEADFTSEPQSLLNNAKNYILLNQSLHLSFWPSCLAYKIKILKATL